MLLGFEDYLFGVPEYSIHPADGEHGEDDVRIFAPLEQIPEDIVGNTPDEGDNFILGSVIHKGVGRG
jgi:hypothetical protein